MDIGLLLIITITCFTCRIVIFNSFPGIIFFRFCAGFMRSTPRLPLTDLVTLPDLSPPFRVFVKFEFAGSVFPGCTLTVSDPACLDDFGIFQSLPVISFSIIKNKLYLTFSACDLMDLFFIP